MVKSNKKIALILASLLSIGTAAAEEKKDEKKDIKEKQTKKEQTEEKTETVDEKKKIKRNYFSTGLNYTSHRLPDKPYQYGFEATANSEINLPIHQRYSVYNKFNFSLQKLFLYDYDFISRTETEIEDSLELRTLPFNSGDIMVYFGVGAIARRYEDAINYKNEKGHVKQIGAGPRVSINFLSNPIDVALSGYYLLGEKQASYDIARGSAVFKVEAVVIPRYDRFEFKTSAAIRCHSLKGDSGVAGTENELIFGFQPSIDIFNNFGAFGNGKITHQFLGDRITGFYGGGGIKVKW